MKPISLSIAAVLLWALLTATVRAEDSAIEAGMLFNKNCATCHGKDGRAKTFRAAFNKARNLSEAQWQDNIADAAIVESITRGRGKMPAFMTKLSEPQIAALAQYVRSLKQPPPP